MYQAYTSTYKVTSTAHAPPRRPGPTCRASAANGCPQGSTTSLDPILFTDPRPGGTSSRSSPARLADLLHRRRRHDLAPEPGRRHPLRRRPPDHRRRRLLRRRRRRPADRRPYPQRRLLLQPGHRRPRSARVSRDGGTTFGAGVPTYSLLDCGGLHGHVKVAPDGTAYLPNKGCGGNQACRRLHRQRHDLDGAHGARQHARRLRPGVGIGANGTVYFGYADADGTPARRGQPRQGRDLGRTTRTSAPSSASRTPSSRPSVAGDDDRAAFAFLGTTTGGNYQDAANFQGVWHLYVATTYDGGKTWVTSDATPERPGPARLDLHRRHHLRQRPQPARLHRRRPSTATAGSLVGFADGCIDACVHRRREQLRRLRHDRPAESAARCSVPTTPCPT